jgi:hypothetical protein
MTRRAPPRSATISPGGATRVSLENAACAPLSARATTLSLERPPYGRFCPVHVWPVLRCPPREVVDHRRRAHEPGIGLAGRWGCGASRSAARASSPRSVAIAPLSVSERTARWTIQRRCLRAAAPPGAGSPVHDHRSTCSPCRSWCSRWTDPDVHVAPIWLFTLDRSERSPWTEIRTPPPQPRAEDQRAAGLVEAPGRAERRALLAPN